MRTGKKQHTIPRFYLNQFLHPGWIYLRGSHKPKKVQSAKSVAVENWFYSQDSSSKNLDSINTFIEGNTSQTFRELLKTNNPLSNEQKFILSYLIANLALRNPATINETGKSMLNGLEQANWMAKEIVKTHQIEVEDDTPYVEVGSYIYTYREWNDFLESLRQEDKKGKAMIETTMSMVAYLAPVIAKMSWVIQVAPIDAFFITSNCPVILTNLEGSRVRAGWENADAVGTLPLSPDRYLILYGSPSGKWLFRRVSKDAVEEYNSRTIHFAFDAIYSRYTYKPVDEWLRGNKRG